MQQTSPASSVPSNCQSWLKKHTEVWLDADSERFNKRTAEKEDVVSRDSVDGTV